MLTHLSIKNFAIVRLLDIEFSSHSTAITGETGAGKSISIDALGLCLGERAESNMVRKGADKAEVTATFSVKENQSAQAWLQAQDLEDEDHLCIIRRVVSKEGRSRAWINGIPATLQQLKAFGALIVNIHGQHAHQELLKPESQRAMLDESGHHDAILANVKKQSHEYNKLLKHLQSLLNEEQQRIDRKQLLQYQLQELDEFELGIDEFPHLEAEFKKLSHSQALLEDSQICLFNLYESEQGTALSIVDDALDKLSELVEHDPTLSAVTTLLSEAQINIQEAAEELRHYVERLEIDPLRMQQTENRYGKAMELARKHTVMPEMLAAHHQALKEEHAALEQQDNDLASMNENLDILKSSYFESAAKLHSARVKVANKLSKQVTEQLHKMNMPHATFSIEVVSNGEEKINSHGTDEVRFLLAANKGIEADSIEKVASGGELSRIGLALQVLTNKQSATLMFDEVDVGISGATASVVGQLLRDLGERNQVICVTHLPQVAAKAHQQMLVTKFSDKDITETHMQPLSQEQRIEELARLLAGDKITDSALENAKGLLQIQQENLI
ncbi:DNA repair protein RecN [Alteromonas sp. a30]|uniref:DNA repair protein RecN n=1 Tax=Alteromonas sp. a30 TaxID=2730917 RepID=UPI00228059C5|nr:DNA repair protein RecN [Alteromonas sp. a30]MCY7295802.1 DNA repair protein RecN [Alteromonas sp. a30]